MHRYMHPVGSTASLRGWLDSRVYGLVPLASIGKLVGVPTPTMDALITLGSVINETDYRREGRTVERLGLAGMTVEEIVRFVTEGPTKATKEARWDGICFNACYIPYLSSLA